MVEAPSHASGSPGNLTEVAVYERFLPVGVERIWENVLDWEHLPWLHRSSFASVEPEAVGRDGFRVRLGVDTAKGRVTYLTEVALDRPALRYVTRTLAGPGAGTEIWTSLRPDGPRATRIYVSFLVPVADPARADAVGQSISRLYTRLWDEDEAMMIRRQALLDARDGLQASGKEPASISLGSRDALRARLPFVVEAFGEQVRIVELDGAFLAYSLRCPHLGGPLEAAPVEDGCVTCPWHGYRFDLRSGRSADGRGLTLSPRLNVQIDPISSEVTLWRRASAC